MSARRSLLTMLLSVLFLTAGTAVPSLVHLCGGEPTESRCPPLECCGDVETSSDEGEPCCDDKVTIRALDTDYVSPGSADIPVVSASDLFVDGVDILPARIELVSRVERSAAPPDIGPPDCALLCVLLI